MKKVFLLLFILLFIFTGCIKNKEVSVSDEKSQMIVSEYEDKIAALTKDYEDKISVITKDYDEKISDLLKKNLEQDKKISQLLAQNQQTTSAAKTSENDKGYEILRNGLKNWDREIVVNNGVCRENKTFYSLEDIRIKISLHLGNEKSQITVEDLKRIKDEFISITKDNNEVKVEFTLSVSSDYYNTLYLTLNPGSGLSRGDLRIEIKIPDSNESVFFYGKLIDRMPTIKIDTPNKDSKQYWDAMQYNEFWIEPEKDHCFILDFSYQYSFEKTEEMFREFFSDIPYSLEKLDDYRLQIRVSPRKVDNEKYIYLRYDLIPDSDGVYIWSSLHEYPSVYPHTIRVKSKKNVTLEDGISFEAWDSFNFMNISPDKKYVIACDRRYTECVPWNIYWLCNINGERIKKLPPEGLKNVPFWVNDSKYLYYMGDHSILSYEIETSKEASIYELEGDRHSPMFAYNEENGQLALVVAPVMDYGDSEYIADIYMFSSINDKNPRIVEKAMKIYVYDNVYFGNISFIDENTLEVRDSDGKVYTIDWLEQYISPLIKNNNGSFI